MRLTLEPTPHFFMAGEVMVRMWQGTDQMGVEVVAFVSLVTYPGQAPDVSDQLVSIPPPTPEDAARWAAAILEGKIP